MDATSERVKLALNCICTAVAIALLLSGAFQIFHNLEENRCDMTYMFEYPEYIQIHLDARIKNEFPKYSLMVYGEGSYASHLQSNPPSGLPILFIPGNAGSHKQVRSLGSVALRKTEDMGFHFNFFTVDFKEELTALGGRYLWSQTKFVHECIKVILRLYKKSNAGNHSLVLVGHSMGGVIARGLFTLPNFDRSSVSTIIALASPNLRPPVMVDGQMLKYYSEINALWGSSNHKERKSMMHLVFVSIGGGNRDVQVHSRLVSPGTSFLSSQSFSVIASAVPKVWLSTDHRCIVWCKQLVLAIARALIDLVDGHQYKMISSVAGRLKILRYHLFSSFSQEKSFIKARHKLSLDTKVDISSCKLVGDRQYFQSSPKLNRECFLIDITEDMEDLHIMYTGTLFNWIGECESTEKCEFFSSQADMAEVFPAKSDGLIKVVKVKGKNLFNRSRVIFLRLNDPKKERIYIKVKYKENHTMVMRNPLGFANNDLFVRNERTFLKLKFPFMRVPWLSYRLFVNATCKQHNPSISAKLRIPWLKEDVIRVFDKSLDLRLTFNIEPSVRSWYNLNLTPVFTTLFSMYQSPPLTLQLEEMPELILWFDSKCDFDIKTYFDFVGTAGQMLKFSYDMILRWVVVFLILNFGPGSSATVYQFKYYGICLWILILYSFYNLEIVCLEGLAVIFFDIFISSCIVSFLYSLAQALIYFSKLICWFASSSMAYIKPHYGIDRASLYFSLFYLELILITGLQFVTCDGVALIVFIAMCIITGSLARKEPNTLCLIALGILLRLPSIVTWVKETQDGYPTDFNLASSVTCVLFVAAIQTINHCQDRMELQSVSRYGAYSAVCFLLTSSNINLTEMSSFLTIYVMIYCCLYKYGTITLIHGEEQ